MIAGIASQEMTVMILDQHSNVLILLFFIVREPFGMEVALWMDATSTVEVHSKAQDQN